MKFFLCHLKTFFSLNFLYQPSFQANPGSALGMSLMMTGLGITLNFWYELIKIDINFSHSKRKLINLFGCFIIRFREFIPALEWKIKDSFA